MKTLTASQIRGMYPRHLAPIRHYGIIKFALAVLFDLNGLHRNSTRVREFSAVLRRKMLDVFDLCPNVPEHEFDFVEYWFNNKDNRNEIDKFKAICGEY